MQSTQRFEIIKINGYLYFVLLVNFTGICSDKVINTHYQFTVHHSKFRLCLKSLFHFNGYCRKKHIGGEVTLLLEINVDL